MRPGGPAAAGGLGEGEARPSFGPEGQNARRAAGLPPLHRPPKTLGIAYRSDFFANVKGFDRI